MHESDRLVATLKRRLKSQGYTYRTVGRALGLSEPSVKRMFSRGTFSLDRLVRIAEMVGMSVAELAQDAERSAPRLRVLSETQERELVSEPRLLLVAACVLNGWAPEEIFETYALDKPEIVKHLVQLDRMGLIALLPGDRVRLNVARDFEWRPGGAIQRFFQRQEKDDYLSSDFSGEGEALSFIFAMLSPAARTRLKGHVDKLRDTVSDLHRESFSTPFDQRSGMCVLIAHRTWEPRSFAALRRVAARRR